MKLSIVLATLVATVTLGTALRPAPAPTAPTPALSSPVPVAHCQVPCGIYGDLMRVQMIMEDAATIAKGMAQIEELGAADGEVVGDPRVIESGAVITSQGPGTSIEFALALVARFASPEVAERLRAAMLVHAPPLR